jgi:cell division protein FtsZ
MVDRRQFVQSFLSALTGASMTLPSQTWALAEQEQALSPFLSTSETWSTTVAKGLTTEPKIKVIGVGGAGCNAVRHIIDGGVSGMEYLFVDTNVDALNSCAASKIINLHRKALCIESKLDRCCATDLLVANEIRSELEGTHLLFITAGMGGATGTEVAPLIARIAKEMDIETVALVTMPFSWEGVTRMRHAEIGLAELQSQVGTLIVLPNDKLVEVLGEDATMVEAFDHANDVIKNSMVGIARFIRSDSADTVSLSEIDINPDQSVRVVERALASLFLKTGIW